MPEKSRILGLAHLHLHQLLRYRKHNKPIDAQYNKQYTIGTLAANRVRRVKQIYPRICAVVDEGSFD